MLLPGIISCVGLKSINPVWPALHSAGPASVLAEPESYPPHHAALAMAEQPWERLPETDADRVHRASCALEVCAWCSWADHKEKWQARFPLKEHFPELGSWVRAGMDAKAKLPALGCAICHHAKYNGAVPQHQGNARWARGGISGAVTLKVLLRHEISVGHRKAAKLFLKATETPSSTDCEYHGGDSDWESNADAEAVMMLPSPVAQSPAPPAPPPPRRNVKKLRGKKLRSKKLSGKTLRDKVVGAATTPVAPRCPHCRCESCIAATAHDQEMAG